MRNFTGYFWFASKLGGLTMKPWTLTLPAPVNQKFSSGDIEIWDRTESLRWVSCCAFASSHSAAVYRGPRHFASISTWHRLYSVGVKYSSVGALAVTRLNTKVLPSAVRDTSSLC